MIFYGKNRIHMKKYLLMACTLLMAAGMSGCAGRGDGSRKGDTGRIPQASDALYTQAAAMSIYAYQPERALRILDSAVIVGNLPEWQADVNRARVYSATQVRSLADSLLGGQKDVRLDTAKAICERLLSHDSLQAKPRWQQDVLEILTYTLRMQNDTTGWLQRSRELVAVCKEVGPDATVDGLRTEAEIGAALCDLGQMETGMEIMDCVLAVLSDKRSFSELDALIIASKRKIVILASHNRYAETLPLARRIIERLNDYEAHPEDYHDGSHREPKTDDKRADYIRFYRTQAQNYITAAYSSLDEQGDMLAAFRQIEDGVREVTAREYTARYKALQQQMETERQKAKADRAILITIYVSVFGLLALVFAVVVIGKNRVISRKNGVLVQQVTEALNYKELYMQEKQAHEPKAVKADTNAMTDEQLFTYISEIIKREKLFLNPKFERQTIMDRFHLSKERVGSVFSRESGHAKLTGYIQQLRLEYAARLLVEQPEKSIVQIAAESGFSSHKYFSERFRQYFSMTPSEFREAEQ